MLPTFPRIVQSRQRMNRRLMKQLVSAKSPILDAITQHTIHEGKQSDILRYDGSIGRTNMKKHSATTEILRMPVSDFGINIVIRHLSEMAEQFADSMTKDVFEVVSEGAEASGNVVDGKGKPLSGEMLLEALETIESDFDDDGTWRPPTIVVSPQQFDRLMSLYSPEEMIEFNKKTEAIIERKRVEHRRREAGRVLAG